MGKDESGCDICQCAPAPEPECGDVMCALYCENGFKKDDNGCDVCECHQCSRKSCFMFCSHGFAKDDHGCDMCQCAEPEPEPESRCPEPNCLKDCRYGFVQDSDGCDTCRCAPMSEEMESQPVDTIVASHRRESCSLEYETGPCRANIDRWYYDPITKECLTFTY